MRQCIAVGFKFFLGLLVAPFCLAVFLSFVSGDAEAQAIIPFLFLIFAGGLLVAAFFFAFFLWLVLVLGRRNFRARAGLYSFYIGLATSIIFCVIFQEMVDKALEGTQPYGDLLRWTVIDTIPLLAGFFLTTRTIPEGTCTSCGDDLRATPTRCPECGAIPPR